MASSSERILAASREDRVRDIRGGCTTLFGTSNGLLFGSTPRPRPQRRAQATLGTRCVSEMVGRTSQDFLPTACMPQTTLPPRRTVCLGDHIAHAYDMRSCIHAFARCTSTVDACAARARRVMQLHTGCHHLAPSKQRFRALHESSRSAMHAQHRLFDPFDQRPVHVHEHVPRPRVCALVGSLR